MTSLDVRWNNSTKENQYGLQPMNLSPKLTLALSLQPALLATMKWFEPLLLRPLPPAVIEAQIWMAILALQKSLRLSRRQLIATQVLSEYKHTTMVT